MDHIQLVNSRFHRPGRILRRHRLAVNDPIVTTSSPCYTPASQGARRTGSIPRGRRPVTLTGWVNQGEKRVAERYPSLWLTIMTALTALAILAVPGVPTAYADPQASE